MLWSRHRLTLPRVRVPSCRTLPTYSLSLLDVSPTATASGGTWPPLEFCHMKFAPARAWKMGSIKPLRCLTYLVALLLWTGIEASVLVTERQSESVLREIMSWDEPWTGKCCDVSEPLHCVHSTCSSYSSRVLLLWFVTFRHQNLLSYLKRQRTIGDTVTRVEVFTATERNKGGLWFPLTRLSAR